MKHLLTKDIAGADWGRIVSTGEGENAKVLLKGFDFGFSPYQLINLGLTSGTLWADRNIGAASPEDAGLYFQWGDVEGKTADQCGTGEGQKPFTWDDYKFGTSSNLSKYNTTDNKLLLDPEDDAAKVNMGSKYSMPTKDQFIELFKETTPQLVLSDDSKIDFNSDNSNLENGYAEWNWGTDELGSRTIKGIKFISKTDTTKELFFPASGSLAAGSAQVVGAGGYFWSASRYEGDAGGAWGLGFGSVDAGVGYDDRYVGLPVRGVVGGGVA